MRIVRCNTPSYDYCNVTGYLKVSSCQQALCVKSKKKKEKNKLEDMSHWSSSLTYEPSSLSLLKKYRACLSSVKLSDLNHTRGNIFCLGFTGKCLMLFLRSKGQFTRKAKGCIFTHILCRPACHSFHTSIHVSQRMKHHIKYFFPPKSFQQSLFTIYHFNVILFQLTKKILP